MAREDFVRMRHLTEVAGRATFQAKDQCRGPQVEELFSRSVEIGRGTRLNSSHTLASRMPSSA